MQIELIEICKIVRLGYLPKWMRKWRIYLGKLTEEIK